MNIVFTNEIKYTGRGLGKEKLLFSGKMALND